MRPVGRFSVATVGNDPPVSWLKRLFGGDKRESAGGVGAWASEEEHRANKQQADTSALEVEGDPRGGLQVEQYRTADPRDVVEAEGTVMSGPAGAPQEDATPQERRDRQGDGSIPDP
jgi:hypothetical protein